MTSTVPSTAAHALSRALQLLAEEAPAEQLDALTRAYRTDDRLGRALADARRVRALLEQRRHRERELHALADTARDLTSLRGTDDVLRAIVDRVRRLLGCDSTYIALVDPDTGEAYMRITTGTRTRAIETLRQPPGSGVGGWIVQTGEPMAVSDYRTDPRLRRTETVASAVVDEGFVSMLGVPIKLGSAVLGALFAANRYRRTFEQAEVALLSSLAGHAAVVLENARLYEQVQQTSAELRAANTRLRAQGQALERAAQAHEQLMPMALRRLDLPEFAATLAGILGGTVAVVSSGGAVLGQATVPGAPPVESVLTDPDTVLRSVPVRAGRERFGRLLFARREPITAPDDRTLERAAQTAALLLVMQRQTAIVERELRAELVEDLVADQPPSWPAFHRRAARLGAVDFDRPLVVAVASATEVSRRRLVAAAAEFATRYGGVVGEHAGQVVALLPVATTATPAGDLARVATAELSAATGGRVTVGAAGPARTAEVARTLHRAAARCHRLLLALGRAGEGAGVGELGVLGTLLEDTTADRVARQIERTLGPLLRYDRDHRAHLVQTLDRYVATGHSPPAAARELGVHVNTVHQRLDRIDQVLGHRAWREQRGRLELQLALHLHRLHRPRG